MQAFSYASENLAITNRISMLENDKVKVWKTIIAPSKEEALKVHRHDNNRVLIALTSGKLKVVNDKGKVHYLNLASGKAYYLKKDIPYELHKDINIGKSPIKVIVVELKK